MSFGMTPYEFVQQVYYAQEKVVLDFWPDDDKYKEVLMEGNLVLQELQKEQDWTWLREPVILGPMHSSKTGFPPEFTLPPDFYKPSMLFHDRVRLYRPLRRDVESFDDLDPYDYIEVPWMSRGQVNGHQHKAFQDTLAINPRDHKLGAIWMGNTITFSRPLTPWEEHRIAVADMQRRIPLLHICSDKCKRDDNGKCLEIEERIFEEIPDPNYVVFRTAALHAQGSPPAQGRIADLTDTAQKLLSGMRQNDVDATEPDALDYDHIDYVSVI